MDVTDDDSTIPSPRVERIGRYLLVRRLGQGGMAEVFLARQEGPSDFQKTVVVKRMLSHLTMNKKFVEMFLREARVAARLNHPNVVQLFELGQDQGTYFLAMEFIDGITLHRLAKRAWHLDKALPTEVLVRAMADAAIGLHHAHTIADDEGKPAGLVHRDISPDNLMMTKDGVTKVLDFGIAKGTEQKSGVTKTGELKGKIPYMSPEQIEGRPLDARTDLFSLGVTFYWLLCGKRPFDGVTEVMTLKRVVDEEPLPPSTVNKSVPAVLDHICMRLLQKDPNRRYGSALDLHDRLVRLLGEESASRKPAIDLVAEMIAARDPDDDDLDSTLKTPRPSMPASKPISKSFAPTTVTRTALAGGGRGALLGITAAAVVGALASVTLLVLTRGPPERTVLAHDAGVVAAALHDAGALAAATSTTPSPGTTATSATTPSTASDARDAGVEVAPEPVRAETPAAVPLHALALRGPDRVTFKIAGAPKHGGGVVKVKPGVKSVVAVDAARGSTHSVPVVNDVADFAALGTGTLRVAAVPYAQVFIGSESLGQTPPAKPVQLPAGDYVVKLVFEATTKTQKVAIEKGKTSDVRVKMTE